MKNKLVLLLSLSFFALELAAQVGINNDLSSPDPSAMLDVKSADKGMLVPRMTSAERSAIASPAIGLLVFDTDINSFWFFTGAEWQEVGAVLRSLQVEDGSESNGYVLTSDVNGEASWQPLDLTSVLGYPSVLDFSCSNLAGVTSTGPWPYGIAVSGNYACVIDFSGDDLKVYDVSDPSNMVLTGSVAVGNNPEDVAASGNYAYVVNFTDSDLMVVDISDPNAPAVVGGVAIGTSPENLAVSGNYVYVVCQGSDDMQVVDVSNSASPVVVGTLGLGTAPFAIDVAGSYAYVVDAGSDDLKVIDVSNPASPSVVGTLAIGTSPLNVKVAGNYAFVTDAGSQDLKVIDVSNPSSPVLTGSVGIGQTPLALEIKGNYAFVVDPSAGSQDIKVVNFIDPSNPVLETSIPEGSSPGGISVVDNYAIVIDDGDVDLKAFELSCHSSVSIAVDPFSGEQAGMVLYDVDNSTMLYFDGNEWIEIINGNDNDVTNELQTLSQTGTDVTLSQGGGTISVADNDNDSSNEIQNLAAVLTEGNDGGAQDMTNLGNVSASEFIANTDDTPTLRLYQNGATWPQYTWDVAGNEVNFFIRDVNESSNLPFRIKTGSLPNRITIDGSNVGIGLNTNNGTMPTATESLDVGGRIRMREGAADGFIPVSDAGGAMTWTDPSSLGFADNLGNHTATENLQLNGNYLSGDGDTEGIFVDVNGNVGVGTASPGAKLGVAGNVRVNSTDPILEFRDETGTNGVRKNEIKNNFSSELGQDSPAEQSMVFNVANNSSNGGTTSVMTLQGDGNVGIGTTTPSSTLDVNGEVRIQGGNPAPGARLVSTDDFGNAEWQLPSQDYFFWRVPNTFYFQSSAAYHTLITTTMEVKAGDYLEFNAQATADIPSGSGIDIFYFTVSVSGCTIGSPIDNAIAQPDENEDDHNNKLTLTLVHGTQIESDCTATIRLIVRNDGDDAYNVNYPRMSVKRIR